MIYLDTSYMARLYLCDPGFEHVRALATSDRVACSCHGEVELFAVFHRKYREGVLDAPLLAAVLSQYDAERTLSAITWLPITEATIQTACQAFRALAPSVFLRAADALHLAGAKEHGFLDVYSNDRHLIEAATHFGIKGVNIIPPPKT